MDAQEYIYVAIVFDKMFVCELNLSWEWMHRWHPEYPAHVSELECFPWVRTRVTRLRIQKIRCNHSATWANPYLRRPYRRLRCVASIRKFTQRTKLIFRSFTRVLTKTGRADFSRLFVIPGIFVGQRRMAILCRPELDYSFRCFV